MNSEKTEYIEVSRSDYQEILLARMAGGDLYASEKLAEIRRADQLFDVFREKPLYAHGENKTHHD